MPVITIRGQMGSGAPDIGRQVARLIQGDCVDRQVIAEVADLLKRPEAQIEAKEQIPPQLLQRIVEPLRKALTRSGSIDSAYLRTWQEPLDDAKYLDALESESRPSYSPASQVQWGSIHQGLRLAQPCLVISVPSPEKGGSCHCAGLYK
jgi:hypothetical protein